MNACIKLIYFKINRSWNVFITSIYCHSCVHCIKLQMVDGGNFITRATLFQPTFSSESLILVTVLCHEGIKTILLKMMSVKTRRYQVKNGVLLTFLPQYYFNRMTFSTVMLMPVALVGMLLFIVFINMPYTSIIFYVCDLYGL